jgi:hypothetical protein
MTLPRREKVASLARSIINHVKRLIPVVHAQVVRALARRDAKSGQSPRYGVICE